MSPGLRPGADKEPDEAGAQFNLALKLQDGRDCQRDYAAAAHWHFKAAQQGHAGAQYCLALLYTKGLGRPENPAKAAIWYRRAARSGHQTAQFELAVLYDRGTSVKRNPALAYVWYSLASVKGRAAEQTPPHKGDRGATPLKLTVTNSNTVAYAGRTRAGRQLSADELAAADILIEDYLQRFVGPYR